MIPTVIYLITVNALGLLLMLIDKIRARKKLWRIPEATLIGAALLGGSLGCIIGMHIFRHKTKHAKFFIGLPSILFFQLIIGLIISVKF